MVLKKLRKKLIKINSKWFLSIIEAYRYYTPRVLIPAKEKVIKPQPCWIYRQKTRRQDQIKKPDKIKKPFSLSK